MQSAGDCTTDGQAPSLHPLCIAGPFSAYGSQSVTYPRQRNSELLDTADLLPKPCLLDNTAAGTPAPEGPGGTSQQAAQAPCQAPTTPNKCAQEGPVKTKASARTPADDGQRMPLISTTQFSTPSPIQAMVPHPPVAESPSPEAKRPQGIDHASLDCLVSYQPICACLARSNCSAVTHCLILKLAATAMCTLAVLNWSELVRPCAHCCHLWAPLGQLGTSSWSACRGCLLLPSCCHVLQHAAPQKQNSQHLCTHLRNTPHEQCFCFAGAH